MSRKSGNWLTKAMLIIGLLAFVGFGFLPLIDSALEAERTNSATAEIAAEPAVDEEANLEELQARERGYELVVQREPENQTAWRGLLEVRLQMNDIEGTLEPLEKLYELNPDEVRYRVLMAQAQYQIGDREAAAATYRDILSDRPGNLDALQGLTGLLVAEGRPEAAIGLLENTIDTAPQLNEAEPGSVDVVAVQLLLGQVYAREGRYEEATATYNNISESYPEDFRPLLGKAIVLRESGKPADALPLLRRARDLAPPQFKDPIDAEIERLEAGGTPPPAPQPSAPEAGEPTPSEEGATGDEADTSEELSVPAVPAEDLPVRDSE